MQFRTGQDRKRATRLALFALIFGLAACSPINRKHGYIPTPEALENVIVGVDTIETVDASVGRPSGQGVLNDGDWFFVQSKWKHSGYREPKEVDRQVVAIRFDDHGVVSNVEHFGLENGRVVTLSRRVTETNISGVGFLAQMFGSFGNFGTDAFTSNQ